jgi:hypothetical protein
MAVTLILGQMLWVDTRQAPETDWGVAVEGGRVTATSSCADLCAQFPEASVVDARDCVITPAFVNAHHHMYGTLSHGIPLEKAPAGFWPFLEDFWWPQVEDQLTHELIAAAVDWACLEMIRSGVTTFYDCLEAPYALPDALNIEAEIVRRWGLRGVLSFEATERVSPENAKLGLRENADFIDACRPLADAGADILEMVSYRSQDAAKMVAMAKKAVSIPLLIKVSANWPDLLTVVQDCIDAGVDGITAIDSIGPTLRVDIEKGEPLLGSYAWLSGEATRPISLRIVADICLRHNVPVVGTGGVSCAQDAVEMVMAGATAVGVHTAPLLKGLNWLGKTQTRLHKWLDNTTKTPSVKRHFTP